MVDPVQAAELLVSRLRINVLEMRAAGAASDQDAREVAAVFSTIESLVDECKSLRLVLEQTRQEREAQAATVKELQAEVARLREAMPSDAELDRTQFALSHAAMFPSGDVDDAADVAFKWLARLDAARKGGS